FWIYSLLVISILTSCKHNEVSQKNQVYEVSQNIQDLKLTDIQKNSLEQTKYTKENPLIENLFGFNSIWTLNDSLWQNGGANGKGPKNFDNILISNSIIWKENIQYVIKITNSRTKEEALKAYYDDRRDQNYSTIEGLGPLTNLYKLGVGAFTTINHDNDDFDVNQVIGYKEEDKGNGGNENSELGKIYSLVNLLRESSASTSASKYFYSSPRPWRMNDEGKVIPLDIDKDGKYDLENINGTSFDMYESNVSVIPALKYARAAAGSLGKDGGYPSGHTNAAYLSSYALAYAFPERFSELILRASELGENRIVAGMHSPLDVIGGRIHSEIIGATTLADVKNKQIKVEAYNKVTDYFGKLANDKKISLYNLAHEGISDTKESHDNNKKIYRDRMTYGFSKTGKSGIQVIVPVGAESILETRFPYLSKDQIRDILLTTAIDSGYPILDESNGWGRLDYVTAADGYGAFLKDTYIVMDESKERFNAFDTWWNNISGVGSLIKDGTGILNLKGDNSYSGGTILKNGTLIAGSSTAFGNGLLKIEGGKVIIDSKDTLTLEKDFKILNGILQLNNSIKVKGKIEIKNGEISINIPKEKFSPNNEIVIISADNISGKFNKITINGQEGHLKYNKNTIVAKI
ncbi:MAG: phosphatase PAP2 family protein, partial [Fusobacteriaceae bacterium]|nr:phosphatase PAP2 family protein [Fusobacteriaceae bacterium]